MTTKTQTKELCSACGGNLRDTTITHQEQRGAKLAREYQRNEESG